MVATAVLSACSTHALCAIGDIGIDLYTVSSYRSARFCVSHPLSPSKALSFRHGPIVKAGLLHVARHKT